MPPELKMNKKTIIIISSVIIVIISAVVGINLWRKFRIPSELIGMWKLDIEATLQYKKNIEIDPGNLEEKARSLKIIPKQYVVFKKHGEMIEYVHWLDASDHNGLHYHLRFISKSDDIYYIGVRYTPVGDKLRFLQPKSHGKLYPLKLFNDNNNFAILDIDKECWLVYKRVKREKSLCNAT